MKEKIQNLIKKEIYVINVTSEDSDENTLLKKARKDYPYFYNRVGIANYNDESKIYKVYDYKIYYPSLDNSFLIPKNAIIEYVTQETHPEYFI